MEAFKLFINDSMIELVVLHTNEAGALLAVEKQQDFKPFSRAEVEAYIGLLISAGVLQGIMSHWGSYGMTFMGDPYSKRLRTRSALHSSCVSSDLMIVQRATNAGQLTSWLPYAR